jgi:single-strand DNA-binding protein
MLRVSLLGNLGAEPEVRYTAKGTQLVTFRVAVNQVRTGPEGERQENTEWFRVRVSGRQADFVSRLTKGSRVLVFGRLDIGHFTSKDGELRTSFDVWADDVQSVGAPRGFTADLDAGAEREAGASEPVLAGVSSLSGTATGRSGSNGKGGRAAAAPAAPSQDLEDLPF